MLNHSFWPARALPAGLPTPPLPWMCHFCSAVFIHSQTRPWPPPHHHQHHSQAHHPLPLPPPRGHCCRCNAARAGRGGRRKHVEPGPELARHRSHVLVEALVQLPVKLLESLGEARVQLVFRVSRRLEVGCDAHQGFNVGYKVLGDVLCLGKRDGVLGGLDLMAGKSEEMNVSTSFMEFRTKPCMMKSKQYFGSSVVPSKTPVTSPALADKLVSINTSLLASPARIRENSISENRLQI